MDFVTKSSRKDETLTSWTLSQHICPHFWAWLLNTIAIMPKSEDNYVVKVVNWSEFHFSEMTLLQNPYFSRLHVRLLKDYLWHWLVCKIKISFENLMLNVDLMRVNFSIILARFGRLVRDCVWEAQTKQNF